MGGRKGGRKRKPTILHRLEGGSKKTHRPLPQNEPHPPAIIPKCPRHLDKEARKEWRRVARELEPLGMLTNLDMAVLASYCQAYSMWATATLKLQEQGMIFKIPGKTTTKIMKDGTEKTEQTGGGYPMINPWWTVINKANEQMVKALVEIGMSPSSRSRVKVPERKVKNEADDFLKEGVK